MTAVENPADTDQASVPAQPRQLIVSLYGLYAREQDGWMSVASVVSLMGDLGVDGQAVRSSISRFKRRGLLLAQRRDGAAGYTLSPVAHEILADGDSRIFERRRATVADGWLLVVFSVPEDRRDKRHQLRSQLTRLGFGTVTPGAWVAPGHLEHEATELLERLGVTDYAEVFRGSHVAFGDLAEHVRSWWDLDGLRALYGTFIDRYAPVLDRWSAEDDAADDPARAPRAFADYVEIVTAWRQLPYADPGLPLDLLPPDWNGVAAQDLFARLSERLAAPAGRHARGVLAARRP